MDYSNIEDRMEKAVGAYERNLSEIRAGRANPAVLNKVKIVIMVFQHKLVKLQEFLYLKQD